MSQAEVEKRLKIIPKNSLLAYSGYLFGSANIGTTSTVVMGVEFEALKNIMPYLDLKSGEMIRVNFDDRNALIGADLAKIAGVKVGDEIDIKLSNSNQVTKVKIRGIVFDGDKEDNLLIISLQLAQKIFNKEGKINYANAIINGNFNKIQTLTKEASDSNIIFEPISKISKSQGLILNKIKLLMALVSLVILIITAICVNTSLSSILLSRLKEVALIRAIGASRKNILNLFGAEIFILALTSAIVGSFLGFLLAQVIGGILFGATINFRWQSIVIAIILSLIFAFLASYFPIKKALNSNMANLLRGE